MNINEQCAMALGWKQRPSGYWSPPGWEGDMPLPGFTELLQAAKLLEDEIEKRGLQKQYMDSLATVVDAMPFDDVLYPWALMRATPEQRAQAFLDAVRNIAPPDRYFVE